MEDLSNAPNQGSSPPPSPTPLGGPVFVQSSPKLIGPLGKVLCCVLLFALMGSILSNVGQWSRYQSYFQADEKIQEKFHSGNKEGMSKIAIIHVEGGILKGDGFIKQQIDQIREDKNVKAIVLRINSPGGTVTASDYLLHHLKKLCEERKLPIVVSMGSLCASGGYYMAMVVGDQKDSLFAEPTTWTGSIGVIIPHFDASGLLESLHVKDDSIASHRFKQLGSPTRSLNDEQRAEERQILQELVNDSFEGFKEVVRYGRPAFRDDESKMNEIATGQVFAAHQALERGLVDRIGFLEDAIKRVTFLARIPSNQVRVVKYARPPALIEALLGAKTSLRSHGGLRLETILDWTSPRAYYLSTWLPSVVVNSQP